jgi:hypothetical protein
MKKIIIVAVIIALTITVTHSANAQGCVAIRSTGSNLSTMQHPDEKSKDQGWELNIGYRYFKSFRHYVGEAEQKQRQTEHSAVINHQHTMDFSIVRHLNNRWSLVVGLPVLANSRSQVSRFGKLERYQTHSFGLGDMRFTAYRWMLDPAKHFRGNFQIGLGLKLPTGDYKYQDYFPSSDTTQELRTVDQSIQLGDGGTGLITEVNGFYNFTNKFGVYGNVYYLLNPREQNGVPTFRSNVNETIMSVADQYMARVGFNYIFSGQLKNLAASLGSRIEGIPVRDLVGGSEGFRRPGYIISAEPGLNYSAKKITYYASVPVALVRNRTQSIPDKETTAQTGVFKQGDAAFADYVINVGISYRF